jgi:hypothetical protein
VYDFKVIVPQWDGDLLPISLGRRYVNAIGSQSLSQFWSALGIRVQEIPHSQRDAVVVFTLISGEISHCERRRARKGRKAPGRGKNCPYPCALRAG